MKSIELNQDLLALIVALSVYVATVRLWIHSRLPKRARALKPSEADPPFSVDELKDFNNRRKGKIMLRLMVPADMCLVVAALALLSILTWDYIAAAAAAVPSKPPSWLFPTVVWSFIAAVLILVAHHIWSWVKTFSR